MEKAHSQRLDNEKEYGEGSRGEVLFYQNFNMSRSSIELTIQWNTLIIRRVRFENSLKL